jgi:hypothetical protein
MSKGPWRNLQFLWSTLHGIPSEMTLKKNTTLLEATKTSTLDGLSYVKKGTKQYRNSPISSIPYAPNWVSNILSVILFSNTMTVFIDTFKHKWSSWTLPHWAQLIDTMSRSSRNLSRNDESLDLQTLHSQNRAKATPTHTGGDQVDMATLKEICPTPNTRRTMRRRRRI